MRVPATGPSPTPGRRAPSRSRTWTVTALPVILAEPAGQPPGGRGLVVDPCGPARTDGARAATVPP